ncbi:MAG TPA: hypothetical protein VNE82_24465 [Candidatus Binataceae bacterium]|nr:hypothetical protein [Candidatus Binataceae bacterium]
MGVEEIPAGLSSSEVHSFVEVDGDGEPAAAKMDEQPSHEMPKSTDGLAQAVAELFEPARQCQRRLAEITEASEAISHLTLLALDLCEPLKTFHDHIKKLSSSFESMRTFRDELGVLAESFAPVKALHQQVIQMAQTVRTHLGEVADGLQPAKALKADIADLAEAINSVSELQVQFHDLSEAFGNAAESSSTAETVAAPVDLSAAVEVK